MLFISINRQQYGIVYNHISQFQQMASSVQSSLAVLLRRIKHILKDFTVRDAKAELSLQLQVAKVTEQLQASNICSQKIVKLMVASQSSERQMRGILWTHLRKTREQEEIYQEYYRLKKQLRDGYSVANSNLKTLVKEILENIRLIEEELVNLNHNLADLKSAVAEGKAEEARVQISLFFLLKIVMEDTDIHFSEGMNELLFRMYILEESISLIFVKTEKVFQEITDQLNGEEVSRRSSVNSEKTGKRSALSESIEIFKRNQLRQELERSELIHFQGNKQSQIQSDYKMTRNIEKRILRSDNRTACCFRF